MSEIEILQKDTYISMIRNAPGTKMFRTLWARQPALPMTDLLGNGKRACAVFASVVLYLFGLVSSKRATVESLERDIVASGWRKTEMPNVGDVIVWEPRRQGGHVSVHIGFFIGCGQAVSNDWKSGTIKKHHVTYGVKKNGDPVRRITAIYTHDFLK